MKCSEAFSIKGSAGQAVAQPRMNRLDMLGMHLRLLMTPWGLTSARLTHVAASLIALVVGLVAATAPAATFLYEPFDYADGSLITNSAGVWTTHSGTTGEVAVANSRAYITDSKSEDVGASLSQQFAPASAATLYARFTVNCAKLPSLSGDYFAHLKSTSSLIFRAKVFALTQGASSGAFRVGLANVSNTPSAVLALDLATNTTHTLVLRYDVATTLSTLWVNPAAETDPSVTDTNATSTITVAAFALRQATGMGAWFIDDLLVGTNFSDVLTLQPPVVTQQPQSINANVGALVNFTVTANGTFPLAYQWLFNGSPIPGATNTALSLTNISLTHAGTYWVTVTNVAGSTNSNPAVLTVNSPPSGDTLSLVHYNLKGNFAPDWTTNAPQVQAIARQLRYLNPDIITLNEIPNGQRHEMTNWMIAFFPGYNLAISSGTDGAIRNGVITRYPFAATNSWLDGASLTNFGYNGTFTRDLFEAALAVPGFPAPLHVFVTHLKSGQTTDESARRAAEANAISNFLVTTFLVSNATHAYVLTGDLNEDIARPPASNPQTIQRLISAPTGLQLTTPLNPFTAQELTFSIQGTSGPTRRYDYILPCAALSSNVAGSQIFRTDVLVPLSSPLQTNDSATASDHLPVVMSFVNPFASPFRLLSIAVTNDQVQLGWESVSNRVYAVQRSTDLNQWTTVATNLVAVGTNTFFSTNIVAPLHYFRVYRQP